MGSPCQGTGKARNWDSSFPRGGDYNAFTSNFEDLYGMQQLPGLAVQRLMAEGYGFGRGRLENSGLGSLNEGDGS